MLFENESGDGISQAFVVAEKTILFEVTDVNISQAISSIIASYYVFFVSYPKSIPALCTLLFFQEYLLESPDCSIKKPARYSAYINSIMKKL